MSLTTEHLEELTVEANRRLSEFGPGKFTPLPLGVVRILEDVIKKWYEEKEESWAMQRISDVTLTAEMALKLSRQGYDKGYQAAKAEMSPAREEAEDERLAAMSNGSAPTPAEMASATPSNSDARIEAYIAAIANHEPAFIALTLPDIAPQAIVEAEEDATRSLTPAASSLAQRAAETSSGAEVDAEQARILTEHPITAPLIPRRPRTLADVDADEDGDEVEELTTPSDIKAARATNRLDPEEKAAQLRDILAELNMMAVAGAMPSQSEWNEHKPDHLPKAVAITARYDLTWREVAGYAHLECSGKPGSSPKGGHRDAVPTQAA